MERLIFLVDLEEDVLLIQSTTKESISMYGFSLYAQIIAVLHLKVSEKGRLCFNWMSVFSNETNYIV